MPLFIRSLAVACCLITGGGLAAAAPVWEPGAGHAQIAIWPGAVPDPQPLPGPEAMRTDERDLVGGRPYFWIENVSQPTITVYSPVGRNSGTAVVVFPGGGFQILVIDLEGTEVCDWLTAKGVTCIVLKYRVPGLPYVWQCDCRPHNLDLSLPSLQDAQRSLRLVRAHAAEWHIDPHRIGVLGFSAGGFLVAEMSTHFDDHLYPPVDATDRESGRPDFAVALYPGHLAVAANSIALNPVIASHITPRTPPTFLLQNEDDHSDKIEDSLSYYMGLKKAGVPVELHSYAQGGHAFGLRPSAFPASGWPRLVEQWLGTIGMLPH